MDTSARVFRIWAYGRAFWCSGARLGTFGHADGHFGAQARLGTRAGILVLGRTFGHGRGHFSARLVTFRKSRTVLSEFPPRKSLFFVQNSPFVW